jgi:PAS domain S-box-containing protein
MHTTPANRSRFNPPTAELLEKISAIAFATDAHGVVVAWNASAERWLGLPAERVMGQQLSRIALPWSEPRVNAALLSVVKTGEVARIDDVAYTRHDGSPGLLGLTASPIAAQDSEETFAFVLGRDITEQRMRDQQEQHTKKLEAIGQLAAGMAHEINTPAQYVSDNLTFLADAFRGSVEVFRILQNPDVSPVFKLASEQVRAELRRLSFEVDAEFLLAEVPRAIEEAIRGMQRVATIVSSMRCFSHPGQQEAQEADLNRAIEDVTTVSCNEWRYDATLQLSLDPQLPPVRCYLSDLSQAILNVVVNAGHAIKQKRTDASAPFGRIRVGTRREGSDAVIWVEDDGCGLPESIRDRIFEPFFTTKPVGKGTGQGLSFTRAVVVDRHHGSIEVSSEEGVGTRFTLRVPIHAL